MPDFPKPLRLLGSVCLIFLCSSTFGASTIREITGANAAAIQATVDAFRNDLGGVDNGSSAASFVTGRREINWDGVPDNTAAPAMLPGNFFNANSTRGALLTTPGTALQVSAKTGNPTGTPLRFGNLNATYSAAFGTFSTERLFTAVGSNMVDVTFFIPGTNTPATVSGFGAVFTDVDITGSTNIQYFDAAGALLLSRDVLNSAGSATLSFLGVSFSVERVARVRIMAGNATMGAADGGATDIVAMDDFIYGEPQRAAVDIFALTSTSTLARFSSASPGTIISTVNINGLVAGDTLQAIDFRPANGQLYGLGINGANGRIYTINTTTGAATQVGGAAFSTTLTGTVFGMDFNPVTDRIRVVGNAGENLRVNPTNGTLTGNDTSLAYAGGDPNFGVVANVIADAHDRNFATTFSTTTFAIDASLDILVMIGSVNGATSPNTGLLTTVGSLGVDTSNAAGLDFAPNGAAYANLTVGGVSGLYQIQTTTGAATFLGQIGSGLTITDIAVAPAGLVQFSLPSYTVAENAGSATITVTRTGGTFGIVTVDYTAIDGSAAGGADFAATSGTLTFAEGDTSKTFTVPIIDDTFVEGNETLRLVLSKPTGNVALGNVPAATLIIADDDDGPRTVYAITNPGNNLLRINADTPGTNDLSLAVTGLKPGEVLVGIEFRPADGKLYAVGSTLGVGRLYTLDTATAAATQVGSATFTLTGVDFGVDFDPQADLLRVVSDQRQNILVDPATAAVTAQSSLNYATGDANQGANPVVTAIAYDNSFAASSSPTLFGIDTQVDSLIRASSPVFSDGLINTVGALGTFSSNVSGFDIAADGTAYASLSVFVNGVLTSQLFAVNVTTGTVTLIGTFNAAGGTIQDIAIAPRPGQFQFATTSATVKETDGTVSFIITRSGGLDGPVTVNYATSDGSATGDVDYTVVNGSVTFGNLEFSKSISIPILNNVAAEADEAFSIILTGASHGATIGAANTATVTIQTAPTIVSPLALHAPVNTAFSYTIVALGTAPIAFNASNLPPGLTFSAGVISGTPTDIASFSVTISASNALGADTQTLVLTFDPLAVPGNGTNSSVDADGDGFSDEVETALGSSPLSSVSTPFKNNAPASEILPLLDLKLGIKLSFSKPNTDSISVSGTLPVSKGLIVAGQKILVDVGGVTKVFTLDAKGATPKGNDTFKMSVKASKVSGVFPQTAKYSAKFSKGSFAALLSDEGLANATVKSAPATIPVTIVFNENELRSDVPVLYSAKAGSSGSVKMVK